MASDVEIKITAETKEALDSISNFSDKSISLFKGFAAAAVAYLGGRAVIGALDSFIDAASESEDAINNLNISLASAGTFSEEASQAFQDFATEIQNTTGLSDELILNQVAIARNFAKSNEEAKKLTQAAIQLSAATGKDLNSSVETLGKSLQGVGGAINKTLPATKNFTEAQLKAGAAIDLVLQRFSGVAESKLLTFSGAVTGAKNAFGDLLEVFGDLIIKNPIIIELINLTQNVFTLLGDIIKDNKDILADFITNGLKALASTIPVIINAFDVLIKTLGVLVFVFKTLADITISSAQYWADFLLSIKPVRDIINALKDGFLALGIALVSALEGIIYLIKALPGGDRVFKSLGINIDQVSASIDNFRDKLISGVGKDVTKDISEGFTTVKNVVNKVSDATIEGLSNTSKFVNKIGVVADVSIQKISKMGSTQVDASKKAIQALNANATSMEALGKKVEDIKTRIENAFKNPYFFILNTIIETSGSIGAKVKSSIEKVQQFINDNPLIIQTAAATAGVLKSLFQSGASSSKILEQELSRAIGAASKELEAALNEIDRQKNESLKKIDVDFSSGFQRLQQQLKDGQIDGVEYQKQVNELSAQRTKAIAEENKRAADAVQQERVKYEKSIITLRENHQQKLNELQEKNVQAAAKVAGEIANAVAQLYGLPPIFGDIIQLLAAPPEVWKSIIDGLVQGIPILIQRLIEAIPTIIIALVDALPDLIVNLGIALIELLTSPEFWLKVLEAAIKLFFLPFILQFRIIEKIFQKIGIDLGAIFRKVGEEITKIFNNLGKNITNAGAQFISAVSNGANSFISQILNGANNFVSQILNGANNFMQRLIDQITNIKVGTGGKGGFENAIGIDIPGVSWATGGVVPPGFPNDTFSANLTSGEMVVPANDVQRLSSFLDNQEQGSMNNNMIAAMQKMMMGDQARNLTINLQVGEKQLASVLLNLNRNGFRTA